MHLGSVITTTASCAARFSQKMLECVVVDALDGMLTCNDSHETWYARFSCDAHVPNANSLIGSIWAPPGKDVLMTALRKRLLGKFKQKEIRIGS